MGQSPGLLETGSHEAPSSGVWQLLQEWAVFLRGGGRLWKPHAVSPGQGQVRTAGSTEPSRVLAEVLKPLPCRPAALPETLLTPLAQPSLCSLPLEGDQAWGGCSEK